MPPLGTTYATLEEARTAIDALVNEAGYAVSTKRSSKDQRSGRLTQVVLHCVHGGKYKSRVDDADRKRATSSKCTGCPFKLTLRRPVKAEVWHFTVECTEHNHPPAAPPPPPQASKAQLERELKEKEALAKIQQAPHPLPSLDTTYATPEEARLAINELMKEAGYAVSTKRSSKDPRTGRYTQVVLQCDRGGTYKSKIDDADRQRVTTSKCVGCPFRLTLRRALKAAAWHLTVECTQHNHAPSPPTTHRAQRIDELKRHAPLIRALLESRVTTRQIVSTLRNMDPKSCVLPMDIDNFRHTLQPESASKQNVQQQQQARETPAPESESPARHKKKGAKRKRGEAAERAGDDDNNNENDGDGRMAARARSEATAAAEKY